MKKKLLFFAVAGLTLLAGAGGVALAQSIMSPRMMISVNHSGSGQLVGTVANTSDHSITVNSWGGAWIIDTTNARVYARNGTSATSGDIKVGDQISIEGTFGTSGWTITARSVRDDALRMHTAVANGMISNMTSLGFTLTNGKSVFHVNTNASTTVAINGTATTTGVLVNGERVQVEGMLDITTSTINATHIVIRLSRTSASADADGDVDIHSSTNGVIGINVSS